MLHELDIRVDRVAVELNLEILDRSDFDTRGLREGDRVEILSFIGGGAEYPVYGYDNDRLVIAGREFKSRLWVGTGKYKDFVETKKAIEASGADVVTVAVRRVNITIDLKKICWTIIDPKKYIDSSEHCRMLHGGGCRSILPVGSCGRRV